MISTPLYQRVEFTIAWAMDFFTVTTLTFQTRGSIRGASAVGADATCLDARSRWTSAHVPPSRGVAKGAAHLGQRALLADDRPACFHTRPSHRFSPYPGGPLSARMRFFG